jgi:CubicO group peptidase (beta-lactamase class C family)
MTAHHAPSPVAIAGLVLAATLSALAIVPAEAPAQRAPVRTAAATPLNGLDAYVERALRDWQVPGLAIAIVRNDSVILAKGYGVREVGKPERVDANTIFAIASTTKAFTSASMGMLVDAGTLDWDDPVAKWLPYFRVADPIANQAFAIRDILTHRSGLERGDLLWATGRYDRKGVVSHLRYLRQIHPFRTTYGYSNNMFITAGMVITEASGMSWDDFVTRRIFTPLGMRRTNTTVRALDSMDNVARPHEMIDGRIQPVPYYNLDNEGPGGSINSSVADMSQWLRFQLGDGTFEGKRLISRRSLAETHTPETIIHLGARDSAMFPGIHHSAYAMGWQVQDYRGRTLVQHSGGIDGMRSRVALVPEANVGLVILTNRGGGNMLFDAIRNRVLDALLGAQPRDWSAEYLKLAREDSARGARDEKEYEATRVAGTKPSLPLESYAGSYTSDAYGDASVTMEGDHLVLTIGPRFIGDMTHWHYDTFRANWRVPTRDWGMVTFYLDQRGKPTRMWTAGFGDFTRNDTTQAADSSK